MIFGQVKKDSKVVRTFSYTKGKVSLNFSLRTDIKNELKDFSELLEVAQQEVKKELERFK